MAIPEKPLSRVEQYAEAIYQKLSGGGGENPNRVETVTGTLERKSSLHPSDTNIKEGETNGIFKS